MSTQDDLLKSTDESSINVDIENPPPLAAGESMNPQESEKLEKKMEEKKDTSEVQKPAGPPKPPSLNVPAYKYIPVGLVMGLIFGFAIGKSRVFAPEMIVRQLILQKWIMMKMFLMAIGTSSLGVAYLKTIPSMQLPFKSAMAAMKKGRGWFAAGLGGLILGVGMAFSGACPGTVFVQLGAGVPWAFMVILGGFIATFLFNLFEKFFRLKVFPIKRATTPEGWFLHLRLGVKYEHLAVPFGLLMVAISIGIEILVPTSHDIPGNTDKTDNDAWFFSYYAWPAWVAGAFLGVVQMIAVSQLGDTMGSASVVKTIYAKIYGMISMNSMKKSKFLESAHGGLKNHWPIPYIVFGAVLGGLFAAMSTNDVGDTDGPGLILSLIGGILIFFGSYLAGGCTSSHGLSGMPFMAIHSFIAVTTMFIGAIGSAFLLDNFGLYSWY
eukprot:TRINITY_DN1009_c0_g3_i1.p1 TRINITY_DN1009_c0_g3~~TRINITY_DN1009_c0_g3_i1.p1  ORF type:complete len:437 (-),score=122.29 TRINITY_DN1009_c0_g3_i1:473-1783(-)